MSGSVGPQRPLRACSSPRPRSSAARDEADRGGGGVLAPGEGIAARRRAGRRTRACRGRTAPDHRRLHVGPHRHSGGTGTAAPAPGRRCADHTRELGRRMPRPPRPPGRRGGDPAAVPHRPSAGDGPLRRAARPDRPAGPPARRQGVRHPRRHRRRAAAADGGPGAQRVLAVRAAAGRAPGSGRAAHRGDRGQVRTRRRRRAWPSPRSPSAGSCAPTSPWSRWRVSSRATSPWRPAPTTAAGWWRGSAGPPGTISPRRNRRRRNRRRRITARLLAFGS
jgi:hypothetical protein